MPFSDAAQAAFRSGETETVTDLAQTELQRSTAAGDTTGQVESRYYLSRVALRQGDLAAAQQMAEQALEIAVSSGTPGLEERARHVLAAIARMTGDLTRARQLYQQSIALNQSLGNTRTVATEYYNLATCEIGLGQLEQAANILARFRRSTLKNGWNDLFPYVCLGEASLASARGDHQASALMLGVAQSGFAALGQVPDPDDAAELDKIRAVATAVLGGPAFEETLARGKRLAAQTVLETLDG